MTLKAQIIDLLVTRPNETLDEILAEYEAISQGDSENYTAHHQLARDLGISTRALHAFAIYYRTGDDISSLIEKIKDDHLTARMRKIHDVLIEKSKDELKALVEEIELIKKNRQLNGHLWIFDEKLLSSRRYKGRSLAAVARSLNLSPSELDELVGYAKCNIYDLEKFIITEDK
jgi:hypothetical protein